MLLRRVFSKLQSVVNPLSRIYHPQVNLQTNHQFSTNLCKVQPKSPLLQTATSFLRNSQVNSRSVTKYSLTQGKRRTVHVVLKKFYRLNWGIWIRTIAGRHKKLYKKSAKRKLRIKRHVFCNATQSRMLDKMVTSYWRRPKYYVDDPYEPYHTREEFSITATKPRPYIPPEERLGN